MLAQAVHFSLRHPQVMATGKRPATSPHRSCTLRHECTETEKKQTELERGLQLSVGRTGSAEETSREGQRQTQRRGGGGGTTSEAACENWYYPQNLNTRSHLGRQIHVSFLTQLMVRVMAFFHLWKKKLKKEFGPFAANIVSLILPFSSFPYNLSSTSCQA